LCKDYETDEHVVGFLNASDRAKFFGKFGAFWGGLVGVLFGSALIFVPLVGHVVILGPLAAAIAGAIEGGVEGAAIGGAFSALGGALSAIGLPENSVVQYETELKANKFLLVLAGAPTRSGTHVNFSRRRAMLRSTITRERATAKPWSRHSRTPIFGSGPA